MARCKRLTNACLLSGWGSVFPHWAWISLEVGERICKWTQGPHSSSVAGRQIEVQGGAGLNGKTPGFWFLVLVQ